MNKVNLLVLKHGISPEGCIDTYDGIRISRKLALRIFPKFKGAINSDVSCIVMANKDFVEGYEQASEKPKWFTFISKLRTHRKKVLWVAWGSYIVYLTGSIVDVL